MKILGPVIKSKPTPLIVADTFKPFEFRTPCMVRLLIDDPKEIIFKDTTDYSGDTESGLFIDCKNCKRLHQIERYNGRIGHPVELLESIQKDVLDGMGHSYTWICVELPNSVRKSAYDRAVKKRNSVSS